MIASIDRFWSYYHNDLLSEYPSPLSIYCRMQIHKNLISSQSNCILFLCSSVALLFRRFIKMTKLCELKADICYYSESVMMTIKLPNVNAVKVPHSLYSAVLLSLKLHLLRGLSSPDFLTLNLKFQFTLLRIFSICHHVPPVSICPSPLLQSHRLVQLFHSP